MDLRKCKAYAQLNLRNMEGWHTDRRIIVIESDDWGSVRMPSREVHDTLLKAGIRVDNCPYNSFDSLESGDDLVELFELLRKFTDLNGTHPVITTNFVMANPDFQKIKASGYSEYYYELFTDTYKRYPNHNDTLKLCMQGMEEKLIYPQFHGREHLNVNRWMTALQQNLRETKLAFDNELFGLSTTITNERRRSYLAAFDFDSAEELEDHKKIIVDGLEIFKNIFGYRSETFIAANYIWHSSLEGILAEEGIKFLQGSFIQIEPSGKDQPSNFISHRLGKFNKYEQVYLTRNSSFEPSLQSTYDPVGDCLKEIEVAFRWGSPAIIVSHRLNYIGSINEDNRAANLKLFHNLLYQITQKWKNIEFMNSPQLGSLIRSDIAI